MSTGLLTASEKPWLNLNHNEVDKTVDFLFAFSSSFLLTVFGGIIRPKKSRCGYYKEK